MALDTTNNAMVLAAYDPSVTTLYFYRVSLSGDQMERYATVTAGSFAVNSVYIDSANRMMYWGSASGNLVGLRVANCARSCLDCSGDPDYWLVVFNCSVVRARSNCQTQRLLFEFADVHGI